PPPLEVHGPQVVRLGRIRCAGAAARARLIAVQLATSQHGAQDEPHVCAWDAVTEDVYELAAEVLAQPVLAPGMQQGAGIALAAGQWFAGFDGITDVDQEVSLRWSPQPECAVAPWCAARSSAGRDPSRSRRMARRGPSETSSSSPKRTTKLSLLRPFARMSMRAARRPGRHA
ncbi:MAG TPA: hypothetical protein VFS57_10075, partial [Gemmatimonadaceae bacterium]|nr:hypothetical protein [Gemmatimonadaceae bacterium]